MLRDLAHVRLSPETFEQLRALCSVDRSFPDRYDDWLALAEEARVMASASGGDDFEPLVVDPAAFQRWCTRVGIVPCIDALRAYAIVHRVEADHRRYGAVDIGPDAQ